MWVDHLHDSDIISINIRKYPLTSTVIFKTRLRVLRVGCGSLILHCVIPMYDIRSLFSGVFISENSLAVGKQYLRQKFAQNIAAGYLAQGNI